MMDEFGEIMRELGADWDEPDDEPTARPSEIGLPDEEITTWVDTSSVRRAEVRRAGRARQPGARTSSSCGWAGRGSPS